MIHTEVCSLIGQSLPVYTVSCEEKLNENLPADQLIKTISATSTTNSPGIRKHSPTYLGCMYVNLYHYEAIIEVSTEMMEEEDLEPSTCQTACLAIPGHMR